MTKNSGNKGSQPRSPISMLITVIVIVLAIFFTRLTGIDIIGILSGTPSAPVATTVPPATAPPTASPTSVPVTSVPGSVTPITMPLGIGAEKGFWRVFFTAPSGESDASTYVGGIDIQLAADIAKVTRTLDIAAFEFNNVVLTQAILDAHKRGVQVRMVTDNEHGLHGTTTTMNQFKDAGIPIVDDGRSALMHNKFMILDSTVVWMGSWNYTMNETYRNNNNALALRSRRAVEAYQAEFNEMFVDKQFGPRSPTGNSANFTQDGIPIQIYFAPEDKVVPIIVETLNKAQKSIRFMAFSFTLSDLGNAIKERAAAGVNVQGIFELRGSETAASQLTTLFCTGLQVRQDGNRYVLHHKVFIIDEKTVITGSFNFSASAANNNDENMAIIEDPDLAAQFIQEFERRWQEAVVPQRLTCN